jgi:hypothetical protein
VQAFVIPKLSPLAGKGVFGDESSWAENVIAIHDLKHSAVRPKANLTWQQWLDDGKRTLDALIRETNISSVATSALLIIDAFVLAMDDLLIATGQLEPVLKPSMTRLRWRCVGFSMLLKLHLAVSNMLTTLRLCHDSLHSNVTELRDSGIAELISHMQCTSSAKVHASP